MKALITGIGGQLGWELARSRPTSIEAVGFDRLTLDLTDAQSVSARFAEERPHLVVNTAAYTAVDKAESDPDAAFAVNESGAAHVAAAAYAVGARLIHISTDFVFDGTSTTPYTPDDVPNPLSVYGKSKAAGERAILKQLPENALIVRTSWLYSVHGVNFVKSMLHLMREKEALSIVADQIGTPSWARSLAIALWRLALSRTNGILHLGDAGVASWYDFAVAIQEEALKCHLIDRAIPISPINTAKYPTPARRPPFSVLDKRAGWQLSHTRPVHWRANLRTMLMELMERVGA